MKYPPVRLLAACAFCLLTSGAPAHACNVPVFRYALERWPADAYDVIVIYKGPLSPSNQAVVDALAKLADSDTPPANFNLRRVDLAQEADEGRRFLETQPKAELPWLIVRYPEIAQLKAPVWAGRLDAPEVKTLLDSPARRATARRILKGESAVWLLLESGQQDKDDAAAQRLEQELKALEKTLRLPERTKTPADQINEDGPPLRIAFSLLRVARTDPAEKVLVSMLLNSEEDLFKYTEPMVFPIFGRGRTLWALVGAGITPENITEAATFLVGRCSCEVKRMNPGVDLLLTARWDESGRLLKEPEPPPLVSVPALAPRPASAPPPPLTVHPLPAATRPTPLPQAESLLVRNLMVAGLLGLGILAGASALVLRRKR